MSYVFFTVANLGGESFEMTIPVGKPKRYVANLICSQLREPLRFAFYTEFAEYIRKDSPRGEEYFLSDTLPTNLWLLFRRVYDNRSSIFTECRIEHFKCKVSDMFLLLMDRSPSKLIHLTHGNTVFNTKHTSKHNIVNGDLLTYIVKPVDYIHEREYPRSVGPQTTYDGVGDAPVARTFVPWPRLGVNLWY